MDTDRQDKALGLSAPENNFLRALAGEATAEIPFWLMRQAGRYLPEYRAVRARAGSFLDLCFNPDLAAAVTLQPVERFDMDAAILFSDILVVPYALGQALTFADGEGPRLAPQTAIEEVDGAALDQKLTPVYETVRRSRSRLAKEKALIGFAGAPWTIACYMIEGRGGAFETARQFAQEQPEKMDALIEKLVEATAHYLISQIKAGVDAVQLFDSWAGLIPNGSFARWCSAPARAIVDKIHAVYPAFPVIGFPRGAGVFYKDYIKTAGVSCVGVDQETPLEKIVALADGALAVQGNLDPLALLAGGKTLEREAVRVLKAAGAAPFVFNLGHGVIKETPPDHVAALARVIKAWRR